MVAGSCMKSYGIASFFFEICTSYKYGIYFHLTIICFFIRD